jgi:hypothetical protein
MTTRAFVGSRTQKGRATTADACDKFISDARADSVNQLCINTGLYFRQLEDFASAYGLALMVDFSVDWVVFALHGQTRTLRHANRVQADKLFLFTAKTGTPVYCPLPPIVMDALNAIPEST